MNDALISIKPKHVRNILSGDKTVELRTRNINLPVGARLWVYTTLPVGKVELSAEIEFVELMPPKKAWRKHRNSICILKSEFDTYTEDRDIVSAIGLRNIRPLEKNICLKTIRRYEKNFQPPQFISKIRPERALYSIFYT